jgi:hypothetical protein
MSWYCMLLVCILSELRKTTYVSLLDLISHSRGEKCEYIGQTRRLKRLTICEKFPKTRVALNLPHEPSGAMTQ